MMAKTTLTITKCFFLKPSATIRLGKTHTHTHSTPPGHLVGFFFSKDGDDTEKRRKGRRRQDGDGRKRTMNKKGYVNGMHSHNFGCIQHGVVIFGSRVWFSRIFL